MRTKWAVLTAAVSALFVLASCAVGGSRRVKYPSQPITLVVPFAAGGSSDLSARPVADAMKGVLNQSVVVVNKPGGAGSIGAADVAKSKSDGYTLLNASNGPITIVPYTTQVNYDYESFEAVAQLTTIPFVLSVSKDSQFKTLKDFIDYVRANPGKIKYGTPGAGSIQHVTMEGFAQSLGIKVTHVPYEGANPAVAALLGGHIEATFTGIPEVAGQFRSGEIRILGTCTESRLASFPEIPTFKESGYNLVAGAWYGVLAPKETPAEVINTLADAFKRVSEDPKVLGAWEKLHLTPAFLGPKEYDERIREDIAEIRKVVVSLGLDKK